MAIDPNDPRLAGLQTLDEIRAEDADRTSAWIRDLDLTRTCCEEPCDDQTAPRLLIRNKDGYLDTKYSDQLPIYWTHLLDLSTLGYTFRFVDPWVQTKMITAPDTAWVNLFQPPRGDKGDRGDPGKSLLQLFQEAGHPGATLDDLLAYLHGEDGTDGATGAPGQSAYQLAVALGFQGDETAWEASLHGAAGLSAYEEAITNGFMGTEAQWLASLESKVPGPQGDPGKDADNNYVIWLRNGHTGTEADFLQWLRNNAVTPVELRASRRGIVPAGEQVAVGVGRDTFKATLTSPTVRAYGKIPAGTDNGDTLKVYLLWPGTNDPAAPTPDLRLFGTLTRAPGSYNFTWSRVSDAAFPGSYANATRVEIWNQSNQATSSDVFDAVLAFMPN